MNQSNSNTIPAYAPTSTTSYTPSSSGISNSAPNHSSNNNSNAYHQNISKAHLIKSTSHRVVYDSLAEIYSIVTVLEVIENSFLKDYITDKEKYTSTALRLINQYQIILKGFSGDDLKLQILNEVFASSTLLPDLTNLLDVLAVKFDLHTPLAITRLKSGIPATIEHLHTKVASSHTHPHSNEQITRDENGSVPVNASSTSLSQPGGGGRGSGGNKASARLVAEATGSFITCMDALKLNYRTKDQLHPLLSDLVISLNDLVTRDDNEHTDDDDEDDDDKYKPIEFQGKSKLVNWLIKLNNLQKHEELTQEEVDLFLKDLDSAYKGFYVSLE